MGKDRYWLQKAEKELRFSKAAGQVFRVLEAVSHYESSLFSPAKLNLILQRYF